MLFILVVIIVAAVVLLMRPVPPRAPFAEMFPPGAIAYAGMKEGRSLANDILMSNCWKGLSAVESVRRFTGGARAAFENAGAPSLALKAFAELLGTRAAVAVYPKGSRYGTSVLAAVTMGGPRDPLLDVAKDGMGGKPAGDYGGMELISFSMPRSGGIQGVYAHRGDTGIVALSETHAMDLAKAAIDLKEGRERKSLAADAQLKSGVGEPLRGGALLGCIYLDVQALRRDFGSFPAIERALRQSVPGAGALRGMVGGRLPVLTWGGYLYRDRGLIAKTRTRLDTSMMKAGERAAYGVKPGKLGSLAFVPDGVVVFSASRMGDLKSAWKPNAAQPAGDPLVTLLSLAEEKIGVDLDRDVFPWLGDEVGIQISDVLTGGLFPIAQVELILKTKDRAHAERAAGRAMQKFARPAPAAGQPEPWAFLMPQVRSDEYRGEKMATLSYPIPGFAPSYALLGDYLVIALNASSVHETIDVRQGERKSILGGEKFAEMRRHLPGRLNTLTYLDCERALDVGGRVLAWFLAVKKLAGPSDDPDKARQAAQVEADLPAILSALKAFRAALSGSAVRGDVVDQVVVLRVQDI
jgi:hypothetical protein